MTFSQDEYLSWEERREISNLLVVYHAAFYKFWDIIRPKYSEEVPTAAVAMNKSNKCLEFLINKKFWNQQSDVQKTFIICHELYHLLNCHGSRIDGKCTALKNQALDIPINEGLVKYFDFDRSEIDPENKLCWLDTVFQDEIPLPTKDKSFEYYYDLLRKNLPKLKIKLSFNDHSDMPGMEDLSDIFDELIENLDEESVQSLKDILSRQKRQAEEKAAAEGKGKNKSDKDKKHQSKTKKGNKNSKAGDSQGDLIKKIEKKLVRKKPKWETIVKKWARRIVEKEFETNHWLIKNRRNVLLPNILMLPNDIEIEDRKRDKEKIEVVFICDSSGSCEGYAERFWKAAETLDKKVFKIHLWCFDTQPYKLDKKERNLYGFGGTDFRCLTQIQDDMKKELKNKKLTYFVLTDGYGSSFTIDKPTDWKFFLTEGGSASYFSHKSKVYNLIDFE